MRVLFVAVGVAALSASVHSGAQQASRDRSFEVASIKPARRELPLQKPFGCQFGPQGERFMAFGTLQWLIACAFDIPMSRAAQQISGAPRWYTADLFEIEAKSPSDSLPVPVSDRSGMLRTLLADRFKLTVHHEAAAVPMYALVLSRRDGKTGPRLRPTVAECAAWLDNGRRGAAPRVLGDVPCGLQRVSATTIRAGAMTMARLADMLSPRVGRVVRDATGLTDRFDLDLQWSPEARPLPVPQDPASLPSLETTGTSVFTALQEQLGLTLESIKGTLDVLVIDHVERPTED
jgi:uncharacterized protein (TIGR03435 family)